MDSILMQSVLLAIIALIANFDFFTGGTMIARPIITGLLVGIVMGDFKTGMILGATLELAFVGSFSIGAALPPDIVSGAILGTAFAIKMNAGAEIALPLALPIATLILFIKNLAHVFVMPTFVNKADKYAEEGHYKGVTRIDIIAGFVYVFIAQMLPVGLGFYAGADAIQLLINKIPSFILIGLQIATGILPAFGLALLMEPIINKKVAIFFVVGFCLTSYLELPITALAIFGIALALIITGYTTPKGLITNIHNTSENTTDLEGIDYDGEEF